MNYNFELNFRGPAFLRLQSDSEHPTGAVFARSTPRNTKGAHRRPGSSHGKVVDCFAAAQDADHRTSATCAIAATGIRCVGAIIASATKASAPTMPASG